MTPPFCPKCGAACTADARFCQSCGARLTQTDPVRSRFMSVLFCDLVGSTALTESIGNEAMFGILSEFQRICQTAVEEMGGYVAKFMGDGMLAYFGYPNVLKNSADQAVLAALSIVERAAYLRASGASKVQISAAVATGWTVVGEASASPSARETLAIGGTVNLAARLLEATRPGTVVVGDEVCRRLDPKSFARSFQGMLQFKGFSNPVAAWSITRARVDVASSEFIGRHLAISTLDSAWAEAHKGKTVAVDICAAGGYGKTTLARRFLSRAVMDQDVYEIQGLSHRRDQSFACLKPFIMQISGLDASMEPAAQRDHLRSLFPPNIADGLALLLQLVAEPLAPLIRQDRILNALRNLFDLLLGSGGSILHVEDAHWLDPETAALLNELPPRLADKNLFMLATRRPTGNRVWQDQAVQIELAALPQIEAAEMVAALDLQRRLSPATRTEIIDRAGGVPLYLEHITRAMLERPDARMSGAIPDTMVEALLERFDQLGEGQALVEAAAILGPTIPVDVLSHMLDRPLADVSGQIANLVSRGLLGQSGDGTVSFDHALIRDAVLETLLSAQRAELHDRALRAYAAVAPERLEAEPATEAHHHLGASRPAAAIPCLIKAAQRSIQFGNLNEAVTLMRRSETALQTVPDGPMHDGLEMVVQFVIASALVQTKGFADSAVNAAYQRSLELCLASSSGGETEFQIIWGIWAHMLVVGDTEAAQRMSERMDRIAQDVPELAVLSQSARAVNAFSVGNLALQEEACARTEVLYDLNRHRLQAITYLMDARELALLFRIHGRFIAGDLPGWLAAREAAFAHEAALGLPFLAPYIRVFGNAAEGYAIPSDDSVVALQQGVATATEMGQPFWILSGGLWLSSASARRDGAETGFPHQEAMTTVSRQTGLRLTMAFHEALLARSFAELGRHAEAAQTIAAAKAAIAAGQDLIFEPEVLRQEAEIALMADPSNLNFAETQLNHALALAQKAGAKAWSALIVASQARLRAQSVGQMAAQDWLRGELAKIIPPGCNDHPAFVAASLALDRPI